MSIYTQRNTLNYAREGFVCGAAAIEAYRFVGNTTPLAHGAANGPTLGVTDHNGPWAEGEKVNLVVTGVCQVEATAGSGIVTGSLIAVDADGRAKLHTGAETIVGRAYSEPGFWDGKEYIEMLVQTLNA